MRRLVVIIGICAGCWSKSKKVPETAPEQETTTTPPVTEAQKKQFNRFDHCWVMENGDKVYTGRVNQTKSGKPCLHWATNQRFPNEQENFCRDPLHDHSRGVWCYCENESDCENGWEECDVPWCHGPTHRDCHHEKSGYQGNVNHTISGIPCQYWNQDSPHYAHKVPDGERLKTNFCSEVAELGYAWCYKGLKAAENEATWEACDISYNVADCNSAGQESSYGYFSEYYGYDPSYDSYNDVAR